LPVHANPAGIGVIAQHMQDMRMNSCISLERLVKELNRAMQQKELSDRVLRNTNFEKQDLQEQLTETISGFTEVIGGLEDQVPDGAGGAGAAWEQPAVTQEQVREQARENQVLQAELQRCRQELLRLRQTREAHAETAQRQAAAYAEDLRKAQADRDCLQARLKEVSFASASAQQQHELEQAHTQELKRLRKDVECLHGQKEHLRRELLDKSAEREELQQNFLYVKSQLDKVQVKLAQSSSSASSSSSGPGPSREVLKHQQTVDMIGEERSRFSLRLEAMLNDMEKEKAYHEQSVERLMTANARIMEEKDRARRELQRVSDVYAQSVKGLQHDETLTTTRSLCEAGSGDPAAAGGGAADAEEVQRLRAQISAADEALTKRAQENESLKARIRKLAVA